jgi:hypothetical protein
MGEGPEEELGSLEFVVEDVRRREGRRFSSGFVLP